MPRVRLWVQAGGHSVPEHKIVERYRRMWPLVAAAMQRADLATVYDNSSRSGPRIVARLAGGVAISDVSWPDWTPAPLVAF